MKKTYLTPLCERISFDEDVICFSTMVVEEDPFGDDIY